LHTLTPFEKCAGGSHFLQPRCFVNWGNKSIEISEMKIDELKILSFEIVEI